MSSVDTQVLDCATFEERFGLSQIMDAKFVAINEVETDSRTLTPGLVKQMCDDSIIENIVIPRKKSIKAVKRVSLRVMIKTKPVLNSTTGWVCYHRADIERDLEHCCVLLSTAASWQHQWSQQAPYSCCS
jgi:hypothetical protein